MTGYLLAKQIHDLSTERIGRVFGNRDHTSVMSGIRKIKRAAVHDFELLDKIISIKQRILRQLTGEHA